MVTLGKILRNSTRICQFIGANLGDEMDELLTIRNLPEDGAYLYIIEDIEKTKEIRLRRGGDVDRDADDETKEEIIRSKIFHFQSFLHSATEKSVADNYKDVESDCDTAVRTFSGPKGKHVDKDNKWGHIELELSRLREELNLMKKKKRRRKADVKDEDNDADEDSNRDTDVPRKELRKQTLVSRLRELLKSSVYQEQHITILTENANEKMCIQQILKCTGYPIQEATSFPVKRIVVDTLENFEGLESPVIMFIIPKSWGNGYVGTLKYKLCIDTRAISRLEFVVPWDPTERQGDLAELRKAFQADVSTRSGPDL